MDAPMYSNKFTVSTNVQKDEYTISFYLEHPKVDPSGREFFGVENIPVASVILNGRTMNELMKLVTELGKAEAPAKAEKE
ncbi:MAG: hypothetical protein AAGU74_09560 [Bacillota bacterium]